MEDTVAPQEADQPTLTDTDLVSDFWFLVVKIRSQMRSDMNADVELGRLGLNARTYAALALACTHSGPSQRELAEFLTLDARQLVYVVDELEKAGLIERRSHPKDRRLNVIYSTELGQETYLKARGKMNQLEDHALRGLSPADRMQMVALMKSLAFPDVD